MDSSAVASLSTDGPAAPADTGWREFLIGRRRDLRLLRLRLRTRLSSSPLVDPGSDHPVVSLTSHGNRVDRVDRTVESIGRGTVRPSRLVLWVNDPALVDHPPAALRRLRRRGLEVVLAENFGPHTKYHPFLLSQETFDRALVTADDDILYPATWLAGLVAAARREPDTIWCYRAHRVQLDGAGGLTPYASWPACTDTEASPRTFFTGVSGVIYPPAFLTRLKELGEEFRSCAPRADDVWLNAVALRLGTPVRQVGPRSRHFDITPETQHQGLLHGNVGLSGNDEQLRATYTAADRARLGRLETADAQGPP